MFWAAGGACDHGPHERPALADPRVRRQPIQVRAIGANTVELVGCDRAVYSAINAVGVKFHARRAGWCVAGSASGCGRRDGVARVPSLPAGSDVVSRRNGLRDKWRVAVLVNPDIDAETRAMLLVLHSWMTDNGRVSVPRQRLADMFDVDPRRITERIKRARDAPAARQGRGRIPGPNIHLRRGHTDRKGGCNPATFLA
jgi:hypothetical protein